jgi:hypothetical protein
LLLIHTLLSKEIRQNTQIINDKVVIISWKGEQSFRILIHSEDIARSYTKFFEHFWENGKSEDIKIQFNYN